jgi:hypothetical protein
LTFFVSVGEIQPESIRFSLQDQSIIDFIKQYSGKDPVSRTQ